MFLKSIDYTLSPNTHKKSAKNPYAEILFLFQIFLSKQNPSTPLRKITKVAKASPKSLIPNGLSPIENAMTNKCKARIKEENLVYKPISIKVPKTSSRKELIMMKVFADKPKDNTKLGTKLIQLSGEVIC